MREIGSKFKFYHGVHDKVYEGEIEEHYGDNQYMITYNYEYKEWSGTGRARVTH